MKWVNPPVAFMLHAGVPRLLAAGLTLPGLQAGDQGRIALEAYPALVARSCVGRRSEKSDATQGNTLARRTVRAAIVKSLLLGADGFDGRPVVLPAGCRERLVDEPGADQLDAVPGPGPRGLGPDPAGRRTQGSPLDTDPLEGWIVGACIDCA
jgi:hypothetical protein